jgi:hypothetical protein
MLVQQTTYNLLNDIYSEEIDKVLLQPEHRFTPSKMRVSAELKR